MSAFLSHQFALTSYEFHSHAIYFRRKFV